MTDEVEAVEVGDGLRLEYVRQGDPDGIPTLLLHGLTDSWRAWELLLPHLPLSIRTFAISQRGHGDSGRPDDGYTIAGFASDVSAFMDELAIDAAVVVGHSSHGLVAQRFAIDEPERTLGLVSIAAPATVRDKQGLRDLVTELATVTDPLDPNYVREFQAGTFTLPISEAFVEAVLSETLKVPAHVWRACFEGLLDEDVSPQRHRIRLPTLLLWGDEDPLVGRAEQEAMLAQIAHAALVVYPGVGHSPQWEVPERVARDLAAFVGDL